jgi:hypothetical protein
MKVSLEQSDARALLRSVEALLEQKEVGDMSLAEASRFFDAYDKMSRETAEKLRETQASLKRAEVMIMLAVGVVRDSENQDIKDKLAAKLRAEVKPVGDYLAPPSELPGALRNAVSSQIRRWKTKSTMETKAVQEREKAVEALEEALRKVKQGFFFVLTLVFLLFFN